jgi:hypothetical protein
LEIGQNNNYQLIIIKTMTFEGPGDEDEYEYDGSDDESEGEEWKGEEYDKSDADKWKDGFNNHDNKESDEDGEPPKPPTGPTENVRRKLGQSDADAQKLASESEQLKKPIRVLISEKIAELESELEIIDEIIEDGLSTPKDFERKGAILKKLSDLRSNNI